MTVTPLDQVILIFTKQKVLSSPTAIRDLTLAAIIILWSILEFITSHRLSKLKFIYRNHAPAVELAKTYSLG